MTSLLQSVFEGWRSTSWSLTWRTSKIKMEVTKESRGSEGRWFKGTFLIHDNKSEKRLRDVNVGLSDNEQRGRERLSWHDAWKRNARWQRWREVGAYIKACEAERKCERAKAPSLHPSSATDLITLLLLLRPVARLIELIELTDRRVKRWQERKEEMQTGRTGSQETRGK